MDQKELNKLWRRFKSARRSSFRLRLRNQLACHYDDYAVYHARHIYKRTPPEVLFDDLLQDARLGLLDAIDKFDPDRGVEFTAYCGPRIRGAVLDEIRRFDLTPRLVRMQYRETETLRERLADQLNRPPADEELRRRLRISKDQYHHQTILRRPLECASLDLVRSKGYNKDIPLSQTIEDPAAADPAAGPRDRDFFYFLTLGLSRRERFIIDCYYYHNLPMSQIARAVGCEESRISQIHKGILARLRSRKDRLKENLP